MSFRIRNHEKTRSGCKNCKSRRVKCDEVKPKCTACSRRRQECVYVPARTPVSDTPSLSTLRQRCTSREDEIQQQQQHPSPSAALPLLSLSGQYSSKHLLDLRLMHHYSVFTAQAFTGASRSDQASAALLIDVPRLALEHEFLMDTILLVAMIHLGCTDPKLLHGLPVTLYRDQALRSFRQAVANTTEQTISAVRAASQLLATISFASDRITNHSGLWVTNWLALAVGQRNFPLFHSADGLLPRHEVIRSKDSLYGSFADISVPLVVLNDLQRVLPSNETDENWPDRNALWEAAADIGALITILGLPHAQSWLETKIKAWAFDKMPLGFLDLVRNGKPRALVILAYYLVFLTFLPDTWLYKDAASHDIRMIHNMIGTDWQEYIAVPMRALELDDKAAITELLTSQPFSGGEGGWQGVVGRSDLQESKN